MYFLMLSRPSAARFTAGARSARPLRLGAGSRKRRYWRVALSVMRRGTLLLMIGLLAVILLAACAASVRP
jgi:hypothetical protein